MVGFVRSRAAPPSVNLMNQIFYDGTIEENFLGHIFAEIYRDGVYRPFLEGRKDLTIVDCGAHVGIFSIYASKFAKKILAIEPSPDHFEALQLNMKPFPIVECIQAAIAEKDGKMDLFGNDNKTMLSLMPQVSDPKYKPVQVTTITLATLLKDIEHIDFMKLDVEGKEQDILQGEDFVKVAPKIQEIVLEVHVWNSRHPNQIREALKNNGYKVSQIQNDASLWHAIRI